MKPFDPIFDQAAAKTQRALDTFQHAMNQVDAELRRIVSQRPELLHEAEALQSMRGFALERAELVPSEQPAEPMATAVLEDGMQSAPLAEPTPLIDPAQVSAAGAVTPIIDASARRQELHDRRQNDPGSLTEVEARELAHLEELAGVEERRVDTPHAPTEAEGADIGRPADAGDGGVHLATSEVFEAVAEDAKQAMAEDLKTEFSG